MAESFVQLPTDGSGKKVRTFQQTVGANAVEHQAFVLCDSSGNIVDVLAAAPAGTERGLAVRTVGTADISDRAARDNGRVRLYDGVVELDLTTQRGVQSSANNAVPIESIVPIRPTFQAALPEITLATTTGVKEIVTIFKNATPDVDVHIVEIVLTVRTATTAGGANVEAQFISTEAVTPGGASVTPQGVHDRTATSSVTAVRSVVTAAPTVVGQVFIRRGLTQNALAYEVPVFKATSLQDAIRLRALNADGLRITANVLTALTGAPIVTGYLRWIEL